MNLHDAIYTPRVHASYDRKLKTPIQADIRRVAKLREQKVQILDFNEIEKLERELDKDFELTTETNKPTLRNRFISLFK